MEGSSMITTPETPTATSPRRRDYLRRETPIILALTLVWCVFLAGAVWNFEEQTRGAASLGFKVPWLLTLILDGLAVSLATVTFAGSLDGRAAVRSRLGTLLAITASASFSGWWGWHRSGGDLTTTLIAVIVPLFSLLAFEVIIGEVRVRVQRRRGMPAPQPILYPRAVEMFLSPLPVFLEWRRDTLEQLQAARRVGIAVTTTAVTADEVQDDEAHDQAETPARKVTSATDDVLLTVIRDQVKSGVKGRSTVLQAVVAAGYAAPGSGRADRLIAQASAELEADENDEPEQAEGAA